MKDLEEPGLLERVQTAVQPLIVDEEFQLDKIEYGYMYGDVDVQLYSKDVDITFHTMLRASTEVHCYFRLKPEKKAFSAEYLFPALNIDIHLKMGEPIRNLEFNVSKDTVNKKKVIHTMLLEKTADEFVQELDRLCCEIKIELSKIRAALSSENIDETIRLYSIEFRKSQTYGRIF